MGIHRVWGFCVDSQTEEGFWFVDLQVSRIGQHGAHLGSLKLSSTRLFCCGIIPCQASEYRGSSGDR